jgi:Tfp pilus assembly protein PilF
MEDKDYIRVVKQAELFLSQGQYDKALDLYDLALAIKPTDPHLRYCLGSLYSELYKTGIAICLLEGVVKDVPDHAQAWNNLGIAYKNAAQWQKAYDAYMKALDLNYDPMTLVNISGLFVNNGTPEEALKWAEKGLKLAPNVVQLHNHRALSWLEQGKWKEGFKEYEWRQKLPGYHTRDYGCSTWNGEKVGTLVVHGEQGLGDEILFMQTINKIKPLADRLVIECADRLVPVFRESFNVECYATEKEVKEHCKPDAYIPMGSLFNLLGFERAGRYLKTSKTYQPATRARIGISWRGGTVQTHQHLRNFDHRMWRQFAELDAEVISIQYGPAGGMAADIGVEHDQAGIDDFQTLMAMIESCNLIISVCNTAVHTAGALGVPCYVLVPSKASWQFRSGSVFYKSVKHYVQTDDNDWQSVIDQIRSDLAYFRGVPAAEQAVA